MKGILTKVFIISKLLIELNKDVIMESMSSYNYSLRTSVATGCSVPEDKIGANRIPEENNGSPNDSPHYVLTFVFTAYWIFCTFV